MGYDVFKRERKDTAVWDPATQQDCEAGHEAPGLISSRRAMKRGASRAQAMVEFALALPIFLLVLYGLLEVGRLVFMEASVATASREGARFASAYGVSRYVGSTPVIQYQDCTGIRNAAKQVGFLLGLTDTSIQISYDSGPSTTATTYCSSGTEATTVTLTSCNRVVVKVNATYRPILPLFLPLTTQPVSSIDRRTIMGLMDLNNPTSCP